EVCGFVRANESRERRIGHTKTSVPELKRASLHRPTPPTGRGSLYVQFEFTQADLVDANKRLLGRSSIVNVGSWKASIYSAVIVGAIVLLILRNDPTVGLVVGLVAGVVIVLCELSAAWILCKLPTICLDFYHKPVKTGSP